MTGSCPPSPTRQRLALALVSAAVVLLQIGVTRLLSVLLWYHWAFFSVSLSMLGIAAPGVWLSLGRPRAERLPRLLCGAGVLVPLAVAAIVHLAPRCGSYAILLCLLALLPAVLALGAGVCLLLLAAPGPAIGRRYAADLFGACAGAALAVPLMALVPTPELCAALGLLPLGAYALVCPARAWRAVGLGVALLATVAAGRPYAVRHTKQYEESGPRLTPIWEKWTPLGRLTVFDNIFWSRDGAAFGWGMGARAPAMPAPPQYWLEQDGSAGTPITRFGGELAPLDYLLGDVTSVGFQLRPAASVAIVGAGGGRDILAARLSGARRIDAVELNPAIVSALRGRFADFAGHVYDLPGVNALVGEGRSVLARSAGGYDVIQISMIDSWAATAAGAYALSENNLYTLEAYRLYWSRLSPSGLVSTSRWMPHGGYGFEIPRLVLLVQAALRAAGVRAPPEHLALVTAGSIGTVLMSRPALRGAELARLRAVCAERGFELVLPGSGAPSREQGFFSLLLATGPRALRAAGIRLDPPTDDRPFFFQMLSPWRPVPRHTLERTGVNAAAVLVLQWLVAAMGALALVLFFAPFAVGRRLARGPGFWRASLFFATIGLAFMLVELAWLQRFILYLGHPSLATAAVLGLMLLGAGSGAMASARLGPDWLGRWGFAAALAIVAMNAIVGPLMNAALGWPSLGRIGAGAALVVPVGFLLGLFFPLGMVRFAGHSRPWLWALNGAASVLGSALSLALAMEIGFAAVAYLGAGGYALAWLLFGPRIRSDTPRSGPARAA
ncbi:MAG: hypothetical protein HY744_07070 [Deltaproteobacteria bacterium]|nr:hypothetical protein [Deltaproteobacteria bacterium]